MHVKHRARALCGEVTTTTPRSVNPGSSPVANLRVPLLGGEPASRERWTILLRLILLIPQLLALLFVGVATFFVGIEHGLLPS